MLPSADRRYVLVASEWYLSSDGLTKPAEFNMAKAHVRKPDWMTSTATPGSTCCERGVELGVRRAEHWLFSLGRAIIGGWLRMRRCSTLLDQTPSLSVSRL